MKHIILLMAVIGMMVSGCKEEEPCERMRCWNGGICNEGKCTCLPGYAGYACQTLVDSCVRVNCQNDGICVDGTCNCADWYEGTLCEREVREKFYDSYVGWSNHVGLKIFSDTLVVTVFNGDAGRLNLEDRFYLQLTSASGDSASFAIPHQLFLNDAGDSVSITGSGSFRKTGGLKISATMTDNSGVFEYAFAGGRN